VKIIYIANSIIPSQTANSIHVMKMCQAFALTGNDVTLLIPGFFDERLSEVDDVYDYYGVDNCFRIIKSIYHGFAGKAVNYGIFIYTILKTVQNINPDLIYGRFPACYFAAAVGYPTIYESHVPIWELHRMEHFFFKRLLNVHTFRKLIVISDALKRIYVNSSYLSENEIQVVPDAADDVLDFKPLAKWTGRPKKLQVGYMGHLYKGRGIWVISELSKRLPDIDFHLVGGTEEDNQYWKTQATSSNIYFHGYVAPKDVYKWRNSCDVLIAPYQKKVFVVGGGVDTSRFMSPLKIFEYIASKKPVIVSDLPALREILEDHQAIFVACDDLSQWAKALQKLDTNPELRNTIAEAAYKKFKHSYTWKKRATNILYGIAS
jgi:glycosyltransferase involved in cell wall biosynthesis